MVSSLSLLAPQQNQILRANQKTRLPNSVAVVAISKPLNQDLLQKALHILVHRHEALRFEQPHRSPTVREIGDWIADNILVETVAANVSSSVVELAKSDHLWSRVFYCPNSWLALCLPPWSGDGHTAMQLLMELLEIQHCLAHELDMPELPVQYGQYLQWLESLLADPEENEGSTFWLHHNSELAQPLAFPGQAISTHVEPTQRLSVGCWQQNSLPTTVEHSNFFLAAWVSLLGSLTRTLTPAVSIRVSGRAFEALNETAGPFAKFIPLQIPFEPSSSFQSLATDIQIKLAQMEPWQDFFGLIPEQTNPLPNLAFAFDCFPKRTETYAIRDVFDAQDHFDAVFRVMKGEETVEAVLEVNPACWPSGLGELVCERLNDLIQALCSNETCKLHQLPIPSHSERRQLLEDFNPTQSDYKIAMPLQAFLQRAQQFPEQPALAFNPTNQPSMRWTYAELLHRVEQIAFALREKGIAPGSLVAHYYERTPEAIAALLAVWYTGAAYVPLDLAWPPERIDAIMSDANVNLVLSHTNANPSEAWTVLFTDTLETKTTRLASNTAQTIGSTDQKLPAYLIYTSGTTGKPKGVIIDQGNLHAYLDGLQKRLQLPSNLRYALVTNLATDLGNTSLFGALCLGGTLHLVDQQMAVDPLSLGRMMQSESIDVLKITPSHLRALLTHPQPATVLPSKWLVLGGEASDWNLIDQINDFAPSLQIANHYGPSETTVGVVALPLIKEKSNLPLPLGRPLAQVTIYILNERFQPVPIGAQGELTVGGSQIGQGYHRRPALTAERFLPDPFAEEPGSRLYRTGDQAAHDLSGNILFRGRIDRQLKIRGYRVELGDVEAHLKKHPHIVDAVVTAPDGNNLVAYVIYEMGTKEIDPASLALGLPPWMIPSNMIELDQFPLTANGKIDFKRLPKHQQTNTYVAPRTDEEASVAKLWADKLGLEQVGIHDDFFQLGGHSLKALQVATLMQTQLGLAVTMMDIFSHPTIAKLSSHLSKAKTNQVDHIFQLGQSKADARLFMIHPVGGQVHWYRAFAEAVSLDLACYGVAAPGFRNHQRTKNNLEDIAADYIKNIRSIQAQGPYQLGGWSFGGLVAIEIASQLEAAGEIVENLCLIDCRVPDHDVDVSERSLLMAFLAEFGMHHLSKKLTKERLQLPRQELLKTLLNLIPKEMSESLTISDLENGYRLLASHRRASMGYQPKNSKANVLLVRASETVRYLSKQKYDSANLQSFGWHRAGFEKLTIRDIAGDHESIWKPPVVGELAKLILQHMENV